MYIKKKPVLYFRLEQTDKLPTFFKGPSNWWQLTLHPGKEHQDKTLNIAPSTDISTKRFDSYEMLSIGSIEPTKKQSFQQEIVIGRKFCFSPLAKIRYLVHFIGKHI